VKKSHAASGRRQNHPKYHLWWPVVGECLSLKTLRQVPMSKQSDIDAVPSPHRVSRTGNGTMMVLSVHPNDEMAALRIHIARTSAIRRLFLPSRLTLITAPPETSEVAESGKNSSAGSAIDWIYVKVTAGATVPPTRTANKPSVMHSCRTPAAMTSPAASNYFQ